MKHTLKALFKTTAVFALLALASLGAQAKEVKLLAIGNSFAWSLNTYLPKVVNSVDDGKPRILATRNLLPLRAKHRRLYKKIPTRGENRNPANVVIPQRLRPA